MVWEGQPHRGPTPHSTLWAEIRVQWTPSRERPELVPRGQRGKKERVQGEGLGGGQCTLGGDVRACRLVGGESRRGSAERMQCSCGKRPPDAETIT